MTFTSEFEVYDEVYTIMNNVITKCSVRALKFPEVSRYLESADNSDILYGVLPCDSILLSGSVSEGTGSWIWKHAVELGKTKGELVNKMLSNLAEKHIFRFKYMVEWNDARKTLPEFSEENNAVICVDEYGLATIQRGRLADKTRWWSWLKGILPAPIPTFENTNKWEE